MLLLDYESKGEKKVNKVIVLKLLQIIPHVPCPYDYYSAYASGDVERGEYIDIKV